jgi:predicted site-specific integrase-resolvase
MPDISLEQWADSNKVDLRTAQGWAKAKKIPAHKVKTRVLVERTIRKYVIDQDATLPA